MSELNALKKQAKMFLKNLQYLKAQTTLKQISKILPKQCDKLQAKIGDCCVKVDNLIGARIYYQKALKINPTNSAVLFKCGKVYLELGDYKRAEKLFKKCLICGGEDKASLHFYYGIALKQLHQTKSALYHLQQAIKLQPRIIKYRVDFANAAMQYGQYSDALVEMIAASRLLSKSNQIESLILIEDYIERCEIHFTFTENKQIQQHIKEIKKIYTVEVSIYLTQ